MARIWKEQRTGHWSEHFDLHAYRGLPGHDVSPDDKLVPVYTYFVSVAGFTFRFGSVAQIDAYIEFYAHKTLASSRLPDSPWLQSEHDVAQRWYERLPGHLRKEGTRQQVVKALRKASDEFAEYRGRFSTVESRASNLPTIKGTQQGVDPNACPASSSIWHDLQPSTPQSEHALGQA